MLLAMWLRSISAITAVVFFGVALVCAFLRRVSLVLRLFGARSLRRRVPTFSATPFFEESHIWQNKGRHRGFTLVSQFALHLSANVSEPWSGRNLCFVGGCRF